MKSPLFQALIGLVLLLALTTLYGTPVDAARKKRAGKLSKGLARDSKNCSCYLSAAKCYCVDSRACYVECARSCASCTAQWHMNMHSGVWQREPPRCTSSNLASDSCFLVYIQEQLFSLSRNRCQTPAAQALTPGRRGVRAAQQSLFSGKQLSAVRVLNTESSNILNATVLAEVLSGVVWQICSVPF